jgi:hypothetical protein
MDTKKEIQLSNIDSVVNELRETLCFSTQWEGMITADEKINKARGLLNELQSKIYRAFME